MLVAAKVSMTLDDIVGPPLNTVKKNMMVKGLSDWQQTLCLKIRRRKKNTVRPSIVDSSILLTRKCLVSCEYDYGLSINGVTIRGIDST